MRSDLTQSHRRQSPHALAAAVFGDQARVACVEVAAADVSALHPVEKSAIARAVPSRQSEFAAGRLAARTAMTRDIPIPMAADRAPVWPEGIAGSITHAGGWAIAVISNADRLVGVDLEVDEPLPPDVFETVLTPSERLWINTQPNPPQWARIIFSVKECAYKAQYARSGQLFGFEMFEVTLDQAAGSFTATFQAHAAPFASGDQLSGRFSRGGGFILTGLMI